MPRKIQKVLVWIVILVLVAMPLVAFLSGCSEADKVNYNISVQADEFQSSPETRQYAEDFKAALHDIEPELADVLVPQCVYRAGCPEMQPCGEKRCFFDTMFVKTYGAVSLTDIQDRYDAYNKFFYSSRKNEVE